MARGVSPLSGQQAAHRGNPIADIADPTKRGLRPPAFGLADAGKLVFDAGVYIGALWVCAED